MSALTAKVYISCFVIVWLVSLVVLITLGIGWIRAIPVAASVAVAVLTAILTTVIAIRGELLSKKIDHRGSA